MFYIYCPGSYSQMIYAVQSIVNFVAEEMNPYLGDIDRVNQYCVNDCRDTFIPRTDTKFTLLVNLYNKDYSLLYYIHLSIISLSCICAPSHAPQRSEHFKPQWILFFCPVSPTDWTQIDRFGCKCLYQLVSSGTVPFISTFGVLLDADTMAIDHPGLKIRKWL